jgi:NADPH:quinone reductase-like Zn-dependent oxidoreductase
MYDSSFRKLFSPMPFTFIRSSIFLGRIVSLMFMRVNSRCVLRELLEAGKITPVIDSTYHLSEAREAFRHMIEDEIQGKVIITATEAIVFV